MINIFLLVLIFFFHILFWNLIIIHINTSLLRLTNILLILNRYMILHLFSIIFVDLTTLKFNILSQIRLLSIIFLIIWHLLSIGFIVSIFWNFWCNWSSLIFSILILIFFTWSFLSSFSSLKFFIINSLLTHIWNSAFFSS